LEDAIAPPGTKTFVILGQVLYPVEPNLPGRLVRKWRLEPSMSFPSDQVTRALTFFAAHLPRFRMALKADGVQVEEAVEPKFVLTLDGAQERVRAQLGARYGRITRPASPNPTNLGYPTAPRPNSAPAL